MFNKIKWLILVIFLLVVAVLFWFLYQNNEISQIIPGLKKISQGFTQFSDEQDFKNYLAQSESINSGYGVKSAMPMVAVAEMDVSLGSANGEGIQGATSFSVDRTSETNVQVSGIDEPDIIKTDGENIYFSPEEIYYLMAERISVDGAVSDMPEYKTSQAKTDIIKALPAEKMELLNSVDANGQLLISNDTLIVFNYDKAQAYDISDPAESKKSWTLNYGENTSYETARLYNDTLYLVSRTYINSSLPCPLQPIILDNNALDIKCIDIYRPINNLPIDSTFTVMAINSKTGEVIKNISFVGSYDSSVIYMSPENIYVSYVDPGDTFTFLYDFYNSTGKALLNDETIKKLDNLNSYDLSTQTKFSELSYILDRYYSGFTTNEALEIQNNSSNLFSDYYKENLRNYEKTVITRIDRESLNIKATGDVPGVLLNQFSLDEYNNHLRVATTIGERNWFFGFGINDSTINDLYVLDSNLKTSGEVKDLGVGERIYSARFINDKGYLVTFKQTDPFYVFDLSDPNNPSKTGELKIPGYSSYLHQLDKDIILGVGEEDNQVKLSLFNVSNPSTPVEQAKYSLKEYWTDISNNHHAFLQDTDHEIFFIPGNNGAYIFSYANNKLELKKAVSGYNIKRAVYINDYLYLVASDKITVLNENTWEEISSLSL
ncbi:MAG: beta-propeller domain-containing protein [Patescibacteria group bacterium]